MPVMERAAVSDSDSDFRLVTRETRQDESGQLVDRASPGYATATIVKKSYFYVLDLSGEADLAAEVVDMIVEDHGPTTVLSHVFPNGDDYAIGYTHQLNIPCPNYTIADINEGRGFLILDIAKGNPEMVSGGSSALLSGAELCVASTMQYRVEKRAHRMYDDYLTAKIMKGYGGTEDGMLPMLPHEFVDAFLEVAGLSDLRKWWDLFINPAWRAAARCVTRVHGEDSHPYAIIHSSPGKLGKTIHERFVKDVVERRVFAAIRGMISPTQCAPWHRRDDDVSTMWEKMGNVMKRFRVADVDAWQMAHIYAKAFAIESRLAVGRQMFGKDCEPVFDMCVEGFDENTLSVYSQAQPAPVGGQVALIDIRGKAAFALYDVVTDPGMGGFIPFAVDHRVEHLSSHLRLKLAATGDEP
jgi:hypothetical protein